MGRVLDPANPIFRGTSNPAVVEGGQEADADFTVAPEQGKDSLATVPERVAAVQDSQSFVEDPLLRSAPVVPVDDSADLTSLDFDLSVRKTSSKLIR